MSGKTPSGKPQAGKAAKRQAPPRAAASPAAPSPAVTCPAVPDRGADGEKTFFRVRAAAAPDIAPVDAACGAGADMALPPAKPTLIARWLGGDRPPRRPSRRRPAADAADPAVPPATKDKSVGVVAEPQQDPRSQDEVADSYRSASDLTAPDETPVARVVA